jgi:hypothetical protein
VRVESELCVGEFYRSRRKLCAGEFCPSHGELGKRSVRCARVGSAWAVMSCTRASSTLAATSWPASAPAEMSVGGLRELRGWSMRCAW